MRRILVLISFFVLLILSFVLIPKTNVNYDMSVYLPSDSSSKQGMDILVTEFGEESMIQVMVVNVSVDDLLDLKSQLLTVKHVLNVIWLDDYVDLSVVPIEMINHSIVEPFYQNNNALLTIVFDVNSYDVSLNESIIVIREIFSDYVIHIQGEAISNIEARNIASNETVKIMFLLIPVVLILLFLSSHAWIEPVLILITLGVAVLFNFFTNGLLPSVSFITQTMSLALQLALSIDYAIFIIHRYYEERIKNNAHDAANLALKHSFKPIVISALTTIAGFSALLLMRFTIGFDIGIVLSKGIIFSFLSTIIVLPILLEIFDPLLMRTKHKIFLPNFKKFIGFQIKYKYILLSVFVVVLALGFIIQRNTNYLFADSTNGNQNGITAQDLKIIDDNFGVVHQMVIIIPNESVAQEVSLVNDLISNENIINVNALVVKADYMIPRELLPIDLVNYYVGNDYSRMIISTSIYEENEDMYVFDSTIKGIIESHYSEYYIVGQTSAISDIRDSIEDQGVWIMLLTVLAVGLIVGLIFKSYKIPLILISVILCAIWLNMSILVMLNVKIMYIGYLIVMCIQLGATIDYAVLLTNRYIKERLISNKETAMKIAFTKSSVSIMISGIILIVVGFIEAMFSDIDSVIRIGQLLGTGALISLLMILIFLPVLLLIFDRFIIKKSLN